MAAQQGKVTNKQLSKAGSKLCWMTTISEFFKPFLHPFFRVAGGHASQYRSWNALPKSMETEVHFWLHVLECQPEFLTLGPRVQAPGARATDASAAGTRGCIAGWCCLSGSPQCESDVVWFSEDIDIHSLPWLFFDK